MPGPEPFRVDPVIERILMIEQITATGKEQKSEAAYHLTDRLEVVTVYHGELGERMSGGRNIYQNLSAFMVLVAQEDGRNMAQLTFSDQPSNFRRYYMEPTPAEQDELDQREGIQDAYARDRLKVVRFTSLRSELMLSSVLRNPTLAGPHVSEFFKSSIAKVDD